MRITLHPSNKLFVPLISIILALLVAMSPFAIDTYLSAMPVMAGFFGVKINMIEITLTIYFLGFSAGNFIGGPLSDSFGRKRIALIGIVLYGISAFLITLSNQIYWVWALRFTQAFGGGFATVTAMVFVRDWFEGKQVARLATIISMIMMFAPLLAPVIGSFLLNQWGWQSIFLFLTIFALMLLFIFGVFMPESRAQEHLTKKITTQQFIGKYKAFFSHTPAVLMLFTISFAVSGMFTFITGASFVYLDYFKMPLKIFPLLFIGNVALNVILSLLNTILLKYFETRTLLRTGLRIQLVAAFLMLIATLTAAPSFWVIFSLVVVFVGSLGMIFGNGSALILNLMPQIAGSANATIGVTRFVLSFIAGSIPALFPKTSLFPVFAVMFTCSSVANIFLFLFSKNIQSK